MLLRPTWAQMCFRNEPWLVVDLDGPKGDVTECEGGHSGGVGVGAVLI